MHSRILTSADIYKKERDKVERSPFRNGRDEDTPGSFSDARFYGQNLGEKKEPAPSEQGLNWFSLGMRKARESVDAAEAATPLPPVTEEHDIDDGFVGEFEGYTRLP